MSIFWSLKSKELVYQAPPFSELLLIMYEMIKRLFQEFHIYSV